MWENLLSAYTLFPSFLWQSLCQFFNENGRSCLVLGTLVVFLLLETVTGRCSNRTRQARASYLTNFCALVVNDTLLALLSVPSFLMLAVSWAWFHPLDDLSFPWRFLLTLVLLDLTLYLWHRACHTLPWLWWFHRVHHSDPFVNVTTAFRLHFLELLAVTLVKAAFVLVSGVGLKLMLAADTLIVVWVMILHANLELAGECWLRLLFTVPSLHRFHHSARRCEHDHNYGFLFSFWDRLLGTLTEGKPDRSGLDGVVCEGWRALVLPDRSLDTHSSTREPDPIQLEMMIAEAAYYRAERRGFVPGFEMEDWIAAERQIRLHATSS